MGRLTRPLHLKRFWCFQASCVKQARYANCYQYGVLVLVILSTLELVFENCIRVLQFQLNIKFMLIYFQEP